VGYNQIMKYDVVVVGSGPAGWTAAIYAVRAGLKTVVIEGDQPGGQLTITTKVDNYPGFEKGINGPELMETMKKQAVNLGVETRSGLVGGIEKKEGFFETGIGIEKVEGRAIIVATGARARWLGMPGEKELMGKGVSGCATCDGMFFTDKEIAVIGGGDSAVEEAVFLTKFAKKVYVIHRRGELRASQAEQKRLFDNPKIEMVWNSEVREFVGKDRLEKLRLFDKEKEGERDLVVEGAFVAIGRDPTTEFLKGTVERVESGHIKVGFGGKETMTSVEGIFAAGDCVDQKFRQAIVSAGMGCQAAMEVEKWLG
jgi:thioredoxin reductase (NADPH)